MSELVRLPLKKNWINFTLMLVRYTMMVSVVLSSVMSLTLRHTASFENSSVWASTMERISIVGIAILLALDQANALRVLIAGLNLTCTDDYRQHDIERGLETHPVLFNSEAFRGDGANIGHASAGSAGSASSSSKDDLMLVYNGNPLTPIAGYANWVESNYPKLNTDGLSSTSSISDIFSTPLWFTAMGLAFNIGCFLQYLLCVTVAWPLYPLIPDLAYWLIQGTGLILAIGSSISLRLLM